MDDKFINIPNDNKQDYPFCRLKLLLEMLDTTCFEEIFFKTLGTSVINIPMSPLSLQKYSNISRINSKVW